MFSFINFISPPSTPYELHYSLFSPPPGTCHHLTCKPFEIFALFFTMCIFYLDKKKKQFC